MITLTDRIREQTVELAQALIRIPSHNPPGNEDRIAAFAAQWLAACGITSELVRLEEGRSSVVARVPGRGDGSLVVCAHLDTVTSEPERWSIPPLEARIADDALWGLGSADMKSGVAVGMQLMAQLVRQETVPLCDVVLVLTADEEWGYRGAATVAESGLIADAGFLLILEPTAGRVYAGQKGELWIDATFTGRAAHGSMPEFGANAVLSAARFSGRLQDAITSLPEIAGRGRTTINIGRLHGGRQVNIVSDRADVSIDIRVVSDAHHAAVLQIIDRLGEEEARAEGTRFERTISSYHPAIANDGIHPLERRLHDLVVGRGNEDPACGISPYSTDAVSIVPRLGVPVAIYGPGDIALAHQPDEHIELDEIHRALDVLFALVSSDLSLES